MIHTNKDDIFRIFQSLYVASWDAVKVLLMGLSDDEFAKIPDIKDYPYEKLAAQKFGLTDMIYRKSLTYTEIFVIGSYIFRGETKQ